MMLIFYDGNNTKILYMVDLKFYRYDILYLKDI